MFNTINGYINILPDAMKRRARHTVSEEYVWEYQDVIAILDILENLQSIVLGGDVMKECAEYEEQDYDGNIVLNSLEYTYDNWCYDPQKASFLVDHRESILCAREYINKYYQNHGKDYYYTLIVQDVVLIY